MSIIDNIHEALADLEAQRRTILVHPDLELAVQRLVEELPYGGMYEIETNPHIQPDMALIFPPKRLLIRDGATHDA